MSRSKYDLSRVVMFTIKFEEFKEEDLRVVRGLGTLVESLYERDHVGVIFTQRLTRLLEKPLYTSVLLVTARDTDTHTSAHTHKY